MARAAVGAAVDQSGVAVVGEDHLLVRGEQTVVLEVAHPVRVFLTRQQPRQVDHVDRADGEFRQMPPQQIGRGQDLQRR